MNLWYRICSLFFFSIIFIISSCVSPQVQNEFYLGLTDNDVSRKIILFEKALTNQNEYIRRAAAEELVILMTKGNELSSGTMTRIKREVHGFWAEAFDVVSTENRSPEQTREKVLSFLIDHNLNTTSFHQARIYVLRECTKIRLSFSESERAVMEGHHAITRLSYNEALSFFRFFQSENDQGIRNWPEQIPEIFIKFPNLINDLGRAFQFTQSGNEGITQFLKWEANLANTDEPAFNDHRYRLLFMAARISRARGLPNTIPIFEKALTITPDKEQIDINIWNILDLTESGSPATFNVQLEKYVKFWNNDSFFSDILERFLQRNAAAHDWNKIINTFYLIKDSEAYSQKAAYAWVINRAIEENLLSNEDKHIVAFTVNTQEAYPVVFKHITYNASYLISIPSLYYRSVSANDLKLPFFESENTSISSRIGASTSAKKRNKQSKNDLSQAVLFILGFFDNGMINNSIPYIRSMEKDLSPNELRTVAQAFLENEMYPQAWRLINLYINNSDYKIERLDLEILFPRPYLELIEKYANQFNIAPSLLFGLIRTESAFQSAVVSRAGATGLTQLMPATAQETVGRIRRAGGPDYSAVLDLNDPSMNIHIGTFYFDYLMGLFDDTLLSLMAYNGGLNRVRRWVASNSNLPSDLVMETVNINETRDYGKRVTGFAAIYEELYYIDSKR